MDNLIELFTSTPWALEKEIARLNKKAARIGVPLITFTNLGKVTRERTVLMSGGDGEGEVTEHRVPVDVSHFQIVTPEAADRSWVPLAKITPIEGARPFVEALQAGYDITPWADADPQHCDHCNTKRYRLVSYVVRNPEGKVMQLGRNCFQDYVGKDTLAAFEFISVVQHNLGGDDEGFFPGGGCGVVQAVNVRDVVARAEALAAIDGWKNNEKEEDGYRTFIKVNGTHRVAAKRNGTHRHSTEALKAMSNAPALEAADAAIARMRDLDVQPDDEFAVTLQNVIEYDVIPDQKAALAAYVGQYLRQIDQKAALAARAATLKHVGTVGERLRDLVLTVVRVIPREGNYGMTYITALEDKDGNQFTWFASGTDLTAGESYKITGTVKAHSEFRGAPQTILTRCKATEIVNGEADLVPKDQWEAEEAQKIMAEGFTLNAALRQMRSK